jgi:hypothetical protein
MTTMPLARFWQALDEIPEATTTRKEWSERLQQEWPAAEQYLAATGRRAREIACPSPGGDGCPRKIVNHGGERYRAICGNVPAVCDPITVTGEDITCFTLDRKKLTTAICKMLDALAEPDAQHQRSVLFVGAHAVAAGREVKVLVLIPGPMECSASTTARLKFDEPAAILVPTPASIPPRERSDLKAAGHLVLTLNATCTLDSRQRLVGVETAENLLAPLRDKLIASRVRKKDGPLWDLPPGTRWENVTIEFTSKDVLQVKIRGQPTRRIEPDEFGMKSRHAGKPTTAWALLRSVVQLEGRLTWSPSKEVAVRRQKQILSRKLIKLFGIKDDPLPRGSGASYQARFHSIYSVRGDRDAEAAADR